MRATLATVFFYSFLVTALWADETQVRTADRPHTARHGTTVEFVSTPVEAAKIAAKEKKLVFVLHVSGYFEDPDCT